MVRMGIRGYRGALRELQDHVLVGLHLQHADLHVGRHAHVVLVAPGHEVPPPHRRQKGVAVLGGLLEARLGALRCPVVLHTAAGGHATGAALQGFAVELVPARGQVLVGDVRGDDKG